ncbi:sensor histidine kinase/response regulator [Pseudohyphozyma bogoriensis]|nr:sensor histidine kinase/response regulator [Pseudohyphozyma bogoriensis]
MSGDSVLVASYNAEPRHSLEVDENDETRAWFERYARGEWNPKDGIPRPPPQIQAVIDMDRERRPGSANGSTGSAPSTPNSSSELQVFAQSSHSQSDSKVSSDDTDASEPGSAQGILDFYRTHGYLPAPTFKDVETERLATIRKYGLDDPARMAAVDRICRAARRYFQCPILVISLVFKGTLVLASESGWATPDPGPDEPLTPVAYLTSLCPHALTQTDPKATFVVPDASKDWRFRKNPNALAEGGGLGFYASVGVHLPTARASPANSKKSTFPVGNVCVIHSEPKPDDFFTEDDEAMLHDFADMVGREFQLGYEKRRSRIASRQSEFLGKFLTSSLVAPPPDNSYHHAAPTTAAQRRNSLDSPLPSRMSVAVDGMRDLCSARAAAVFDLSALKARVVAPGVPGSLTGQNGAGRNKEKETSATIQLLGAAGDLAWEAVLAHEEFKEAVLETVQAHADSDHITDFDYSTPSSPLKRVLPQPTTAQCVLVIFDVDCIASLLIVLTSDKPQFRFEVTDRKFAQNVGATMLAALIRQRVEEADRAKLAFVSQISHDLRTPLHGISSQLELIREFSSPAQLRKLNPFLDVADVCLESLRDVLDDTLDYAKLTSAEPNQEDYSKNVATVNLQTVVEQAAKATWLRKRRLEVVSQDARAGTNADSSSVDNVDLILEFQKREAGWNAVVDAAGIKRILLNLLVEDTGCGMSESFLRNGKAFQAFAQEDSFSHGAGLGLSNVPSPGGTTTMQQYRVSDELKTLFTPGPHHILATPATEKEMSFSDVVAATQSSLSTTLQRIPSKKIKSPQVVLGRGGRTETVDIIHEASKLSLASSPPVSDSTSTTPGTAKASLGETGFFVAPTPPPPPPPPASKVSVLVADDNPIARNILAKLLSGKNVDFKLAEDGVQAVELYKNHYFNLGLFDIQMPHKDGVEAAFDIRIYELANGLPRCRIIALSGLSTEADVTKALGVAGEGPIDSWVVKGGKSMRIILDEDGIPQPPPQIQAVIDGTDRGPDAKPASVAKSSAPSTPKSSTETQSFFEDGHTPSDSEASSKGACGGEPGSTPATGPLLEFYRTNGYLPAPSYEKAETDRLATIRKYGLDDPARMASVDRICRAAQRYFKCPVLLITLTFKESLVLASEIGWPSSDPRPDAPLIAIPQVSSLCPHALTRPTDAFIVPDASKDWRFVRNPNVLAEGGVIGFYATVGVHLPSATDNTLDSPKKTSPVGNVCVIHSEPKSDDFFTEDDVAMLREFSDMVGREFQLGYEKRRSRIASRQADFLGGFLTSSLVGPAPEDAYRHASPTTAAQRQNSLDSSLPSRISAAVDTMRDLCSAQAAAVFDLSALKAKADPHGIEEITRKNRFMKGKKSNATIQLLGGAGDMPWEAVLAHEGFKGAVLEIVQSHAASDHLIEFDYSTGSSPLKRVLPQPTTAKCIFVIFDVDGVASLLIVLTSNEPQFRFEVSDRKFAHNVGATMLAALIRQRVEEADRAKLAFVSQISHDLRTPLHGISSQLELIREFSSPAQLRKLNPFLDVADVCLESLRDVLDDTLDYAKLTSTEPTEEDYSKNVTTVNLQTVVEQAAKATWLRKRRLEVVSLDARGGTNGESSAVEVDLILEFQKREAGWNAVVDAAGIKRILLNLIGNALTFTQRGHVKISFAELPRPGFSDQDSVVIEVEDTGCGMSQSFLRNGKAFQAFVQEDSFSIGAVVDNIVKRMKGEIDVFSVLGKGTTFRPPRQAVTMQIAGPVHLPSPGRTTTMQQYRVSDELKTLFTPGPHHILATPSSEKELSFSDVVAATQITLQPIPSKRLTRKPSKVVLGGSVGRTEVVDIVYEASKLGLASSPDVEDRRTSTRLQETGFSVLPQTLPVASPKVSVLVADDNPIARNILAKLLSGKNVDYKLAEDGVQAVELYKKHFFNLGLFDIQMPHKDGVEAAFDIRTYELANGLPRCRIIALSGLSTEADVTKALGIAGEGPIDSWVVKGGKSMRIILDEVKELQAELDAKASLAA